MKTLITTLLAFSMFFTSYANNKGLMEATSIETRDNSFTLKLSEALGRVQVSIYNTDGKLIEKNLFKINGPLNIPFNLSQLPEGNYRVKLETREESMNFEVTNTKKVEKKLLAYGKIINNNTIALKVVGIEKPGTAITFYDKFHKKIASDKVNVLGGFSRNYVLKNFNSSDVYVKVVNAEGKTKYLYFD